jgi:hypothetical protein
MNLHPTHKWRFSDSSQYDEICDKCMVTENSPKAELPCTVSGPASGLPKTKKAARNVRDIVEEIENELQAKDENQKDSPTKM